MSTAPTDWLARALTSSLVVVFAVALATAGGCGRTDFNTDGGGDASTLPTGTSVLPETPGIFICGSNFCATASQQCCLAVSSTTAVSGTCMPLAASCSGISLQCDEQADCPASNVCCVGLSAATSSSVLGSLGSHCVNASLCRGTGQFVVCRQDSDCHGLGVCCAGDGLPTCLAACPKI